MPSQMRRMQQINIRYYTKTFLGAWLAGPGFHFQQDQFRYVLVLVTLVLKVQESSEFEIR